MGGCVPCVSHGGRGQLTAARSLWVCVEWTNCAGWCCKGAARVCVAAQVGCRSCRACDVIAQAGACCWCGYCISAGMPGSSRKHVYVEHQPVLHAFEALVLDDVGWYVQSLTAMAGGGPLGRCWLLLDMLHAGQIFGRTR